MLVERAVIYQAPYELPRFMDAKPFEVFRGASVLAAFSAGIGKSGANSEEGLDTCATALHTKYHYAKPLGGGVLLHKSGLCVVFIHDGVSVGHNIVCHIFRG